MRTSEGPNTWRNIARHDETFNDVLYGKLKQTPWWLISIGLHLLIVAVLFNTEFQAGGAAQVAQVVSRMERDAEVPLDDEIKPEIEDQRYVEQPDTVLPPVDYDDSRIDEKEQTDNDLDFEETLCDRDLNSDASFDGLAKNATIGIGGAAGGGKFGRGGRKQMFARFSGNRRVLDAADRGLQWLADHQDPGGFWDCDGFMKMDKVPPICDGAGNPLYDPGVSGLALLAFFGAGETHKRGAFKMTVRSGLKYLKQVQDAEGCFGPRTTEHFTYNHAIASLAMTEAYGLTLSPLFRQSAQRGIDFVHKCQNPYLAWRYGVRPQDNDTSVSGWMIMALKSAKISGLRVDPSSFEGMRVWVEKATEPEYGRVGYTSRGTGPARPQDLMDVYPADRSESLTAVGVLSRVFLGEDPQTSEMIRKGANLCVKALPAWDEASGTIDMYYWYYGSLAMFQVGGDAWERWEEAMKPAILEHQREDGAFKGSWDPVGPWGREGGRVYSTALMVMCMEVYYRYGKLFGGGR